MTDRLKKWVSCNSPSVISLEEIAFDSCDNAFLIELGIKMRQLCASFLVPLIFQNILNMRVEMFFLFGFTLF